MSDGAGLVRLGRRDRRHPRSRRVAGAAGRRHRSSRLLRHRIESLSRGEAVRRLDHDESARQLSSLSSGSRRGFAPAHDPTTSPLHSSEPLCGRSLTQALLIPLWRGSVGCLLDSLDPRLLHFACRSSSDARFGCCRSHRARIPMLDFVEQRGVTVRRRRGTRAGLLRQERSNGVDVIGSEVVLLRLDD